MGWVSAVIERRTLRTWAIIAVVGAFAMAALVVGWQVVALAGPVGTESGFEDDDGNLVKNSTFDWNEFATTTWTGTAPYRQSTKVASSGWIFKGIEDDQVSATDTAFAGGVKQDQNCPPTTGAKAPNKDDLKRIYLSTKNVGGDVFLNLAWVRIPQNTTSPSAHVAFEFNKGSTSCGAGSSGLVQRTAGDMLIVYDFEGGSTNVPHITMRRWITSNNSTNGPCEISSDTAPCWGVAKDLTDLGFAEAKVNTTAGVTDTIHPNSPTPQSLGINEFGEAGINLTDAGVFTAGGCDSFGTVYGVSRSSGNSGTAQMKDLVGPGNFRLSNCGTVIIKKETSPAGDTTTNFDYTTNVTTNPATAQSPFQLKDGGTKTITNVVSGSNLNVTESNPGSNYQLTGIDCSNSTVPAANRSTDTTTRAVTFSIAAGQTLECKFTNTQQRGGIVVEKITQGDTGTFGFTSRTLSPSSFNLTTTATGTAGKATQSFNNLTPGTYDVSETAQTGWDLATTPTCTSTDPADTSTPGNISLSSNETVTCTFTNTKRGNLVVEKVTQGDTGTFGFTSSTLSPSSFNLTTTATGQAGKATQSFSNLRPGSYDVSETVPTGWDLATPTCNDGSSVSNIDISAGETVTCTFTNTRKATTISTVQRFIPQDTVTIGGTGSGTFNGQVDFELYSGAGCTGTPVYYERNVTYSGSSMSTTNGDVPTANHSGPYAITSSGTYHWKVSYHDDTNGHPNATSCVEESTLTIDNDNTTP